MKLKSNYILHETGGETVLVSAGGTKFTGFVRGNDMLGVILKLLKTDITEEKLVAALRARYNAPDGLVESDVKKVLETLRKADAIEE